MSIFQLIKKRWRRKQRETQAAQNQNNERQTSIRDIVRDFSDYIQRKYFPIQVDEQSIRELTQVGYRRLSDEHRETLEAPITEDELRAAVFIGNSKKIAMQERNRAWLFKNIMGRSSKLHENTVNRGVRGP